MVAVRRMGQKPAKHIPRDDYHAWRQERVRVYEARAALRLPLFDDGDPCPVDEPPDSVQLDFTQFLDAVFGESADAEALLPPVR